MDSRSLLWDWIGSGQVSHFVKAVRFLSEFDIHSIGILSKGLDVVVGRMDRIRL